MPDALRGRSVEREWAIPGSTDRFVLLLPRGRGHDENLLRVTSDGELIWRARLPETGDSWVDCRFEGGAIYANSWSSYLVRIDPDTGETISKTFTK